MPSKTAKTAKKTAPSDVQSPTPKKRGRPSKADIAAREAAAGVSDVEAVQPEKKKRGRPKKVEVSEMASPVQKLSRSRKANYAWEQTLNKIQMLVALGAVHIKLDNVEVAIPLEKQATAPNGWAYKMDETEQKVAQLAKVAPMDNPDEYSEAQDRWANHEPMPRI